MTSIYDLVRGHELYYAEVNQIVMDAVRGMVERNIGAVPVLHDGRLAGIFTERDLMKRILVGGLDPHRTRVGEVMTGNPLVVAPGDDLEACLRLMKEHGFRHLPICEGGRLVGVVSLRDILMHDLDEKDGEVKAMRAYIQSTG